MHTAAPGTMLAYICDEVASMKPGQRICISRSDLREIPGFYHNDAHFSPAHRIMENIIGSSYTLSFTESPEDGSVTFARHEDTGAGRYQSPDDAFRLSRIEGRRAAPRNTEGGEG